MRCYYEVTIPLITILRSSGWSNFSQRMRTVLPGWFCASYVTALNDFKLESWCWCSYTELEIKLVPWGIPRKYDVFPVVGVVAGVKWFASPSLAVTVISYMQWLLCHSSIPIPINRDYTFHDFKFGAGVGVEKFSVMLIYSFNYVSGLSVRPSGFFRLRDNSSITWWNFMKLGTGVHHQE